MRFVFTSYSGTPAYREPYAWLQRISFYTGILKELGKKHDVISIERIGYEGELKHENIHYRFLNIKGRITRFPWRMHRFIKQSSPDVIVVNGLVFPLQVMQLRWMLGRKAKIILMHRAEPPATGWKQYLQLLADRFVDAYLFASAGFIPLWHKNISPGKLHEVVQSSSQFVPGDKRSARQKLGLSDERIFLWVGNLNARKDPLTVLKAFSAYTKTCPIAKLYMIWQTGELADNVKQQSSGITRVEMIGPIAHKELQHWYQAADFMIAASHHEGSGVALIEAMSCGCIPVHSAIPSFKTMTGHGACGFMFEAGNEKDLLRVLKKTNHLDLEAEHRKTIRQFQAELSFEAIARKMEETISSLNNPNSK